MNITLSNTNKCCVLLYLAALYLISITASQFLVCIFDMHGNGLVMGRNVMGMGWRWGGKWQG